VGRLAVDIGGTFTDVALERQRGDSEIVTAKTSTTPDNPADGVLTGIKLALEAADVKPSEIQSIVHGTTLATNALIERKGADVGIIVTEGFRDILEIAYERRYDQYDLFIDKPDTIVPRERTFTVPERMSSRGEVLKVLDESALERQLEQIVAAGIESVAVCLLHSYANATHETHVRDFIAAQCPHLSVSLSCEVSPEVREYDRLCTTVANAFIRPLMQTYLENLAGTLRAEGFDCPLLIMTSGGGMTTLETATRFPVRLVESGPCGGAILASRVAQQCGLDQILSLDVGGTTAKICLIDHGRPQTSRRFEIGRAARFIRGSGLPVRIPVVEMIEIGAGGGSIARVDSLGRIAVGPESAGADPGPACYGRGGVAATVTDSDVVIGLIDPVAFADGMLELDPDAAKRAVKRDVADPLAADPIEAATGVRQIVDENMANASRVHAAESGKDFRRRAMVAFGGNGPLHGVSIAERVGIQTIVVPPNPSVGSAIGFLHAPVSYEIVKSLYNRLESLDIDGVNRLMEQMRTEALEVVAPAAESLQLMERRVAFMRYKGQGHEIEVELPVRRLSLADVNHLREAYEIRYRELFQRSVPGMVIEIMNWGLTISTVSDEITRMLAPERRRKAKIHNYRPAYLDAKSTPTNVPVYLRSDLAPGDWLIGPALIAEGQTTTLVGSRFNAVIDAGHNIVMSVAEQSDQ
jgi:N-methylhydantoinase A